jgi:hypothetical protein
MRKRDHKILEDVPERDVAVGLSPSSAQECGPYEWRHSSYYGCVPAKGRRCYAALCEGMSAPEAEMIVKERCYDLAVVIVSGRGGQASAQGSGIPEGLGSEPNRRPFDREHHRER